MKKIKLFLAAVAAMVTMGAQAQTWTGNAPAAGTFFLYNVGAAKFLNNGDPNSEWGTNAYLQAGFGMDIILEANGTNFNLNTNISNGGDSHYLAASTWCDGAATPWQFRAVDGESNVYQIINNGQYLMANEAGNDVEMVGDPSGRTISNTYWKLVSENDFKAAMQAKTYSATDPMDVSVFIKGRSFARNDGRNDTWTRTYQNANNQKWIEGGDGSKANAAGKYYGNEFWNQTFDIHQDIAGLPDGTYEVKCSGFGTNGTTFIYGNSKEGALTSENAAASGSRFVAARLIADENAWAGQTTGTFTLSGGNLTVGLKRTTNQNADWCVYDEFRLYYYGLDLSEFAATLAAAVQAAEAVEGTVPTAAWNTLAAVVTENNQTYTTAADYTAATTAIETATNTAKALQASYARYNSIKTAALALDDDATIFTGDATVNTTTADAEVEAATTVEGINNAIVTLRAAASSFLGAVTVNDGKSFDITNVFITNPAPWASTDGWNCPVAATPNSSARAAEFWNKSGVSITQEMASLPAGYYTLKAQAFARTGCSPIYIFAGAADTDSSDDNIQELIKKSNSEISTMAGAGTWFDGGNGWNTFTYQNETAGSFTIGLKDEFVPNGSHGDNNDGWLIWREFGLLYLGTEPVSVLADLYADAKTAAEAARDNATYANVAGAERAALLAAIADTPEATAESYKAKTSALIVATNSFIDDGVVLAWNNYATSFSNEVTKAIALGLTSEQANSYAATSSTTASGATACIQNLMVAEYNYVTTYYNHAVELGAWNASDNAGTMTSQHWDGTSTSSYLEQGGGDLAYDLNNWTVTYDQTLSLPAGNYIFKVAGRTASDHVTINLNVTDVTDSANPALLGTVNDFPKGDVGLGINKAGATSFDAEDAAGFANNGKGRGWQWRYVKFTLANPASVKVEVLAEADAQHRWMGFCNATVQTDDEDNVALMQALVALNDAKTAATLTQRANVGTDVFQYDATTDGSLWSAYSTAKSNAEAFTLAANTEVEDVTTLTTALTTAQANYSNNTVINAPDASKRYKLSLANKGALTFQMASTEGGYGMPFQAAADYKAQTFFLTQVSGNTYNLSFVDFDGNTRYVCTRADYGEGGTGTAGIRTTDDSSKALDILIQPSATPNVFYMINTAADDTKLGAENNGDFYTTATNSDWSIAEASQASVTVSCKAGKYGTVIFPFTPDVSTGFDGITFYSCETVNGTTEKVQITEVNTPVANVPYLIKNDGGDNFSQALTGWGVATADSYTEGLLTGVFTAANINGENRYVLQTPTSGENEGVQAFYKVTSDFEATPYKCYLTYNSGAGAGVKALGFEFRTPTSVRGLEMAEGQNDAIFNLAGQRVQKAQKGLYIVGGKKVIVK